MNKFAVIFNIGHLVILALVIIAAMCIFREQCPRRIRGYYCRGKDCDHSKSEVKRAKEDMKESRR